MSAPTSADLTGVWGTSANDVFAVGSGGTVLHFDGSAWTAMATTTTANLLAISGSAATDVFAAGENGTVIHYDGIAWTPVHTGLDVPLRSVFVEPGRVGFATDGATVHTLVRTVPW
jgi:hypothetical protein